MKIAFVCSKFPPDVGGGETHIRDLAMGLAQRGHEVRILTGTHAPIAPPPGASWSVSSLPLLGQFAAGTGSFRDLMPQLFAWLREIDADIIHSFNYLPTLAVALVRRSVRARLAISLFETLEPGVRVFDMWRIYDLERAVQGALLAASQYDIWICDSDAYLQWAREGSADTSKLWRGAFCVDTAHFAPPAPDERAAARSANGINDDRVVIGFPSRLVPRKGFEDVLYGLRVLQQVGGPLPTVLIPNPTATSDAVYYASIFALIDSLGIRSQCVLTSRTYTVDTMPEFYAACDFVIQPARAEGLGIALLEAMSMRIPVLCSAVEGHTEVVVDGETGFLFQASDPTDLARTIARALAQPTDYIKNSAATFVKNEFSPERMLDLHEKAYLYLVQDLTDPAREPVENVRSVAVVG